MFLRCASIVSMLCPYWTQHRNRHLRIPSQDVHLFKNPWPKRKKRRQPQPRPWPIPVGTNPNPDRKGKFRVDRRPHRWSLPPGPQPRHPPASPPELRDRFAVAPFVVARRVGERGYSDLTGGLSTGILQSHDDFYRTSGAPIYARARVDKAPNPLFCPSMTALPQHPAPTTSPTPHPSPAMPQQTP
ncbi:hypothetical protein FBZ88_114130 [Nitrospirillum bahiense]|uniref:Uncharacterized protein n=1 Tax=Nitrospirillum amazonense TaxID=28077 RepID=A0A560FNL0_9PROT|nr:hypothetical protein FBZ88_114130 [Nitrospirillum amazonense]